MRGPGGVVYPNKGVFHDIGPPERRVIPSSVFENEECHPGLEALTTVAFASTWAN
jgi:hypothetical protein